MAADEIYPLVFFTRPQREELFANRANHRRPHDPLHRLPGRLSEPGKRLNRCEWTAEDVFYSQMKKRSRK